MHTAPISPSDPHPRHQVNVLDSFMSFVETGTGAPVVFLHGNPTSSYLWRNVIPHVAPIARCLAPDLIGMGESGTAADNDYTFASHSKYLDAWFEALQLKEVILVLHDWGGPLGFHWARRHRDQVKGIAYMETIPCCLSWDDWPEGAVRIFKAMRSRAGEEIILKKNVFIERILPSSIMRNLQPEELARYNKRYEEPGDNRRPMLTWPRQLPFDGEPADVAKAAQEFSDWLLQDTSLPKLFINAKPGSILVRRQREFCRSLPNQEEVTVKGLHIIQEDSPHEIGEALAKFVKRLTV